MSLELRGIHKDFNGVGVLHDVDLAVRPGEVLAVVGANGAGKSTLIRVMAGALPMSQGEILVDGVSVALRSPHDAHRHGIRTVHQELSLVLEVSVTENLLLGRYPRRYGLIDWPAAHARAHALLAAAGFPDIDPKTKAGDLTVPRRQMVEIAKALVGEPRVLVLDEPSAVLAGTDLDALFALVRQLRDRGVGVVYVSHRLAEVLELATSIVVLKDGRVVGTPSPDKTTEADLIRLMAGRSFDRIYPARRPPVADPEPVLRVRNLSRPPAFNDVSFDLHAGEVVGLFGLVGSGRSELARCVFGADAATSGTVHEGQRFRSPRQAIDAGLALVTEDRAGSGLVPGMTVRDNIGLTTWRSTTKGPFIDAARQRRDVAGMVDRLGIRPDRCATMPVRTLSGGNQQKAVFAKWLLTGPRVLILDEPTRGVDMATRVDIYRMIDDLVRAGHAVLLISSDLAEVIGASDRVLVMNRGRLTGGIPAEKATEDLILATAISAVPAS